jgi:hypothetical protein
VTQPARSERSDRSGTWIPAEDRIGLFDRNGLGLSITAGAVSVLWAFVVPLVALLVVSDNELEAGTVLDLGSGASMRPVEGWVLDRGAELGSRPGESGAGADTTELHDGAVTLRIESGVFVGGLEEFMDTAERLQEESVDGAHVDGNRTTFETADGVDGLWEGYLAADGEGIVGTVLGPPTPDGSAEVAIRIVAEGPHDDFQSRTDEIEQMMASIQFEEAP